MKTFFRARFVQMRGIIVLGAVISFAMTGCESSPPPQEQIWELEFNNGTYGPVGFSTGGYYELWFKVQPNVTGELIVEASIENPRSSIEPGLDAYDNNNRRISSAIVQRSEGYNNYSARLVLQVESDKSYLFRLYASQYGSCSITAFNEVQRAEAMRLAEAEKLRVEAKKAEARRQDELAKQKQQQAEQAEQDRLANLYRQAGNNVGNLPNTSKTWTLPSDRRIYRIYNFGNGNYLYESNFNLFGLASTATGTFRVNGDTVIFLSAEGEYSFATIIGNTFTEIGDMFSGGNRVYR